MMELEKIKPSLNRTLALLGVPGFPQDITRKQNGKVKKKSQAQNQNANNPPETTKSGFHPAIDCSQ